MSRALALTELVYERAAFGAKMARRARINARRCRSRPMQDHEQSIKAAMRCLDDFMAAFNRRDLAAWDLTFNFPSVRLASNTLVIIEKGDHKPELFTKGALSDWDHSAWERRRIIHAGPDKVHLDTRFTRYRSDGSVLGGFDSIYVVTCEAGRWGVKARSSFAP